MKYLKQWKWQLVVAAPFLPWLYVQHLNVTYQTALSFGWDSIASAGFSFLTTIVATGVFIAGYARIHDKEPSKGLI